MIKSTFARLLLITTGLLLPQIASAEDDLLLYVFQSGQPQRSATITIDGEVGGSTRLDGSLTADLTAGGHVIAVDAGGDEINGLSLNGVGSGTEISYLQVHDNADDGIEFYGGDVNVKYAVVTAARDDSVDWDEGYRGNMQYVIVKQSPEAVLAAPVNWTDINGTFAESTANTSFLDATDFIGAVNPDGSNPWWAAWTLPGTL